MYQTRLTINDDSDNNNGKEKKTKEDVTRQIVEQAQQQHGVKKFVGLFSGGKDSFVTCHFLSKLGVLDEVLYCNTGVAVPENLLYVLSTCKMFGWKLNTVSPKDGEKFEDFVRKFGFPGQGAHSMVMGYLKWHPMRTWARQHRQEQFAFVSGRRAKESNRRGAIMSKSGTIEHTEKMTFIAPLFHWTDTDIWNYIKDNDLQRCPVYETLHISGDCLCGAFSELGEMFIIKVFHKQLYDFLLSLEDKYGGKWGNGMSARGAKKQSQISGYLSNDDLICNECMIRNT